MPEKQSASPNEPETVGKIAYWKGQFHFLAEPGVIIMIGVVAIVSWNISGWHKAGVIESQKAELKLLTRELNTTVKNANNAIKQMKILGLALATPIVDELNMSGVLYGPRLSNPQFEMIKRIADNLTKLGASQNEINGVCDSVYSRVTRLHVRRIIDSLRDPNPDKNNLLLTVLKEQLDNSWDTRKTVQFIKDNDLKKSKETEECFMDLEYFLENKILRREEKWQEDIKGIMF
jgi:hypothetical protein